MRKLVALLLGIFVVTSVTAIGARMSGEAIAVIVGVVCGAAAGIPVSLLILAATRRPRHYDTHDPYGPDTARAGSYPPVVVIQGGAQAPSWPSVYGNNQMQPPLFGASEDLAPRHFRVVGADEWETR